MKKILLALAILGAGTAGILTARHATLHLQRETDAARETWLAQTEVLAAARAEVDRLAEAIRKLKQSLRQRLATGPQNDLWSVLETNHPGVLAPELREHLLEELGFNWNTSENFLVISKQTLRDIQMIAIEKGKVTDSAAAALALTPQERSQIEKAMERIQADFKEWAVSHTERHEPRADVLAQYTLPSLPLANITNYFTEAFRAIGNERTELLLMGTWEDKHSGGIPAWVRDCGILDKPATLTIKRFSDGNKVLLKAQVLTSIDTMSPQVEAASWRDISKRAFPNTFLPLFPNGWPDVAKREGFEIPTETPK